VKALTCVTVAVSTFALGTSTFAATVTPIEGTVQVNTGSGFHPVSGAAEVAPGTSVMVSPKGRGEIRYSDGCKATVRPGSVAVVPPVSPCAQGQALSYNQCLLGPTQRPINGYGEPLAVGCVDYTGYLVLGLAGAGFGAAIYEATRDHGVNANVVIAPASP
jgi:hypothetical protein